MVTMKADACLSRPPLPTTPPEAVAQRQRETVLIDGRSFVIDRPCDSDAVLDHPVVRAAFLADEYMPYWVDLWPAARMLAKVVLRESWPNGSPEPLHALEIGCGLGLPGIAALSCGLRVTFSDYDATALAFAAANARLNGMHDFNTLHMDWRYPPTDKRFPLLLAADLIYEMRNVEPLVNLIRTLLAPEGICLLTDQDRVPSHVLRQTLADQGMPFTTQMVRVGEPGGRRLKGTLYRIRAAA
jgi:predicted nicotinamide N-methyase